MHHSPSPKRTSVCSPTFLSNVQETIHNMYVFASSTLCHNVDTKHRSLATVNSALVPLHLQHHVSPSIRKLALDYTIPKSSKDESLASECARLRAENASLKMCCDVWCKRAKLHAGTTLGLVGLVRLARDHSMRMKAEKEMFENRCSSLKRTLEEVE